jgi:hypothetical protein
MKDLFSLNSLLGGEYIVVCVPVTMTEGFPFLLGVLESPMIPSDDRFQLCFDRWSQ